MAITEARWIKKDNQSIIADGNNSISIQTVSTGGIEVVATGLQVKATGITNAMLAGSIEDNKLTNSYLYADGTRAMTGDLAMASHKITGLSDGTTNSDAVTYGQLQQISTQGKSWKEAVLYNGQLTSTGILAAQALTIVSNFNAGETITLNDGTITQNLVAGTTFAIGASFNETLQNISAAINSGSIAISAYVTSLDSIDPSNEILVIFQDTVGQPTRIYGDAAAATKVNILDPTLPNVYTGISTDLVSIPTTDPAVTNFGFFRLIASVVPNETHLDRSNDSSYTWDNDGLTWQQSGSTSIAFTSKSTAGKSQAGNGINVTGSGVISIVVGDALTITSDIINLVLQPTSGLSIDATGLKVKVGVGLVIDEDDYIQIAADDGIIVTSAGVSVNVSDLAGTGLENDGFNNFRISSSAAGNGLVGGSGSALSIGAGDGINVDVDSISVNVTAIAGTGLENDGSNNLRIASSGLGNGLQGGSGSVVSVNYGDGLVLSSSAIIVDVTAIAGTGLEDDGSNNLRIASSGLGNGLQGGSGLVTSVKTANGITATASGIQLTTLTADWSLGSSFTIQAKDPVNATDVVNKQWVETAIGNANTRTVERFTLTATDITNKYVTLSSTPSTGSSTILDIKGAPSQYYGDDFTYDGVNNRIIWTGLGLDGVVVSGDKFTVVFNV